MRGSLPSRESLEPNTPLRLSVAAALAFPDGSMTTSGLRKELARGRLIVERIAGKDYTTLANINLMRELCRVEAAQGSISVPSAETKRESSLNEPTGSSATVNGTSPRDALRRKLEKLKGS
jgi:hypothetical protein